MQIIGRARVSVVVNRRGEQPLLGQRIRVASAENRVAGAKDIRSVVAEGVADVLGDWAPILIACRFLSPSRFPSRPGFRPRFPSQRYERGRNACVLPPGRLNERRLGRQFSEAKIAIIAQS